MSLFLRLLQVTQTTHLKILAYTLNTKYAIICLVTQNCKKKRRCTQPTRCNKFRSINLFKSADLKRLIKRNLLHLVGCLHHCSSDARSHKHQVCKKKNSSFPQDIPYCNTVCYIGTTSRCVISAHGA
jgi:hypothetical protein